jgi:Protein of unknown function (DUF3775)
MSKQKLTVQRRNVVNEVLKMFGDGEDRAAREATGKHIDSLPAADQRMLFSMMLIGRGDEPPEQLEFLIERHPNTTGDGQYLAEKPLDKYLTNALKRFDAKPWELGKPGPPESEFQGDEPDLDFTRPPKT